MSKTGSWTTSLNSTRLNLWFLYCSVHAIDMPSNAWLYSSQPAVQLACEDHPCAHVSAFIASHTHYCLIVSPLFKSTSACECFSKALPRSSFSEALLLISTSTYTEQLGFSWVDSTLCYGFQTKSLDVLQFLLVLRRALCFPFQE